MFKSIRNNIRQFRYPRDFRIAPPNWPDFVKSVEIITHLMESQPSKTDQGPQGKGELLDMVTDIGTLVWRLERRLSSAGELPMNLRRVGKDLEATKNTLRQRGFEIQDHTGQDYDGGMLVKVVTSQQVAGLPRPRIIETLKPTIYHQNRIIQMGDVIVGIPEEIA